MKKEQKTTEQKPAKTQLEILKGIAEQIRTELNAAKAIVEAVENLGAEVTGKEYADALRAISVHEAAIAKLNPRIVTLSQAEKMAVVMQAGIERQKKSDAHDAAMAISATERAELAKEQQEKEAAAHKVAQAQRLAEQKADRERLMEPMRDRFPHLVQALTK